MMVPNPASSSWRRVGIRSYAHKSSLEATAKLPVDPLMMTTPRHLGPPGPYLTTSRRKAFEKATLETLPHQKFAAH